MSLFNELKRRNVFKVAAAYTIVAWLLLQVSSTLVPALRLPEWFHSGVALLLILGFPVAMIFAWAFEMTPEGLKHEKDVDRGQSMTQATGRKLNFITVGVLVLALGYFVYDKLVLTAARDAALVEATKQAISEQGAVTESAKSIAVLPFVNMSDDAGNEYFSDGVSEEILNALARVKDLKVAGRTSSFAFKGRNDDLRAIGQALGVSHILEGSVRKAGAKVRITAQLIKTDDGFHLWSETYDRELQDIFTVQDEIAQAIFDQLKIHLLGDGDNIQFTSQRTHPEAFDLYLEAKQKIYMRKRAPLEEAAELLDQAIALDPGYALAYAQRGITHMLLSEKGYGATPDAEANDQAKVMLERALSLNPESAEAWAGRGFYLYSIDDREGAIEALQRALAINPSLVNARNWLANSYARLGQLEEAKRTRLEVLIRDPLYLPGISNALDDYFLYGDIERAQTLVNRVRPFMPASGTMVLFEGVLHWMAGRVADSMPYFESAHEIEPDRWEFKGPLSRALFCSWQYERLAVAGRDGYRVQALMRLGRSEEASILAWELAAKDKTVWPLFALLVEQGRYADLIDYFESNWPDINAFEADFPERDGWSEHNYLGRIAFSYQRLGQKEKFEETMSRYKAAQDYQRQMGANNFWFAFAEAVYAVLNGDHETALDRLARAFEGGFAVDPQLSKIWPMFEPLDGDPRYEAIIKGMVEHVNSERVKLGLEPVG